MSFIFNSFVYQPLYNILIFFYNILGNDFGVAIIATTLVLKAVFVPLSKKQIESQKKLQELQPELKKIQEKNKNNKEKQTKETLEFYKKNKVNPFSGCLPLIFQLVFLIAIYRIIMKISGSNFQVEAGLLYPFITNPGSIKSFFLGFLDMAKPNYYLAFLAAIAQYWQARSMMIGQKNTLNKTDKKDFSQAMSQQMMYLGPVLTFFFGMQFAAGLALYWLASTLFSVFQQEYIFKKSK